MKKVLSLTRLVVALAAAGLAGGAAAAPDGTPGAGGKRLLKLDFRELMEVRITSVAKKPQALRESAAAVTVIDAEEIRRSGARELPELLRLVPGVNVARINANDWAVGIRGFNERYADKLLVLVDGRSVYSPVFSGVYWDTLGLPLEDIERIEVIRGPGGTLWGANAVNGVINIITKHTRDTRGTLISADVGEPGAGGLLRHGGAVGDAGGYRVYLKHDDRDPFVDDVGEDAGDAWTMSRGGFRVDLPTTGGDELLMEGEFFQGEKFQRSIVTPWPATNQWTVIDDEDHFEGGHLLARWSRRLEGGREWTLQGYLDHTERDYQSHAHDVDTVDLDFQYRLPVADDHEVTWGVGYRRVEDAMRDSFTVSFDPDRRTTELWSAFVQDEIRLNERLRVTVGAKFEENDFTGFEWQPSIRFVYLGEGGNSWWGALSRAVHTPSRADADMRLNFASVAAVPPFLPQPLVLSLQGNDALEAEEMTALELGWRGEPAADWSLDATAFYHHYDELVITDPFTTTYENDPAPTHQLISSSFANGMYGESYGVELSAHWQATPRWRLSAGYAWLRDNMHLETPGSDPITEWTAEGTTPEQTLTLRSRLDLPSTRWGRWEFDATLGLVDRLDAVNTIAPGGRSTAVVDGYARLDLRLGWRPRDGLELSLVGQNLLDDRHPEFTVLDVVPSEVPRAVFGTLRWSF